MASLAHEDPGARSSRAGRILPDYEHAGRPIQAPAVEDRPLFEPGVLVREDVPARDVFRTAL